MAALCLRILQSNADLISILLLIILFFIFLIMLLQKNDGKNLPPSPWGLPIIGNLHQLGSLPHRTLASLSKSYGPIIRLRLGAVPAIFISSVDLAVEVSRTQDTVFASRPRSSIAQIFLYGQRSVAFGPYGPLWKYLKKVCVTHLLSFNKVRSFRAVREEEMTLLLASIRSASSKPINLSQMLATFTNDVICRVALGKKYSSEYDGFSEMIRENMLLLGSYPIKDYIPCLGWFDKLSGLNARVKKNFKLVDEFLERVLNDHITSDPKNFEDEDIDLQSHMDFVDVLLWFKNNTFEENITIDRDVLKGVLWEMVVAGTDSTSLTMEWAMAHLLANPSSMKKAQEEIRRVLGSKASINEEMFDQMEYLMAIIKETLRLHPPIPLLIRKAQKDLNLHGYTISAETSVFINCWEISRNPKYWSRPDTFFPERFLDGNLDFKGQHFQFLPFGAGRRICPGMTFSILIIQLVLSNLLCYFNWEPFDEKKVEVLDMTEFPGINICKKFDLLVVAK